MHRIKAIINTKCQLIVETKEEIIKDDNYKYIEFLLSECIDPWNTLVISDVPTIYRTNLMGDGLYLYYRIKVRVKDPIQATSDELYINNDVLYIGNNCVSDLNEIVPYINESEDITKPIFSLCRISKCLENAQRKFIFSEYGFWKCPRTNMEEKMIRDYLFATVFVLRKLVEQQRYEEAKDIIKFVHSCNGICDTIIEKQFNDCGCGGK